MLVVCRFSGASGPHFLPILRPFFIKTPVKFPIDFSDVIFIDSGVPTPPRLSPRLYETLKIENTRFQFLTHFWMHVGIQNGCNIALKCIQKSNRKSHMFCIEKVKKYGPHQGVQGGPTNQMFVPRIRSGTPWAPQATPERLQRASPGLGDC